MHHGGQKDSMKHINGIFNTKAVEPRTFGNFSVSGKLLMGLLLVYLAGCGINPEDEINIIGIWEGSQNNRSWCVEFSADGEMKMSRVSVRNEDKPRTLNQALAEAAGLHFEGVQRFAGNWMLGKGKRLIAKMAPLEAESKEEGKPPRLVENIYFIEKLNEHKFIYSDATFKNLFESVRVAECSVKFN